MLTRKSATAPRKIAPKRASAVTSASARKAAKSGNGLSAFTMHSSNADSAGLVAAVRSESAAHRLMSLSATPNVAAVDPETVARGYLQQALDSKSVAAFTAPKYQDTTSEFKSLGTETVPLTGTKTVKFRQTLSTIPVYGSLITVELDDDNHQVGLNSALGKPSGVSPIAKISAAQAAAAVAAYPGSRKYLQGIVPHLYYYFDQAAAKWRLVFILEDVKVTPEKAAVQAGPSKRLMDYVVDAQSGKVVRELPRTATMVADKIAGWFFPPDMLSFAAMNTLVGLDERYAQEKAWRDKDERR